MVALNYFFQFVQMIIRSYKTLRIIMANLNAIEPTVQKISFFTRNLGKCHFMARCQKLMGRIFPSHTEVGFTQPLPLMGQIFLLFETLPHISSSKLSTTPPLPRFDIKVKNQLPAITGSGKLCCQEVMYCQILPQQLGSFPPVAYTS